MTDNHYRPPSSDIGPRGTGIADEHQDLAAFIGEKNTAYYLERFRRIDTGGRGGWHWPAFFFTSAWLLYRKMWLLALVYIIGLPILMVILSTLLALGGNEVLSEFMYMAYTAATFFVLPFFVNKAYYAKARSRIEKIHTSGLGNELCEQAIAKAGGTSMLGVLAFLVLPIGILAAIAIPAYQDYTIRAEVAEGRADALPAQERSTGIFGDAGDLPVSDAPLVLLPDAPGDGV